MSDRDFFAGMAWLGAAWGMGIAAWLWEARRKRVGSDEGRGVEGNASQRRNGTGRWNPAQGFLVRGQRQRESVGTLVAPIQAGIKPGRPSSEPTSQGGDEDTEDTTHPADATTGPGVHAGARPAFGGRR